MARETVRCAQCRVRGRVQGVFFRASTRARAQALGVSGWVRNRPDGDVEVLAQGEEARVRELIEWLQRGPELARVQSVEVEWRAPEETLAGFELRH
ncbi:MAG: acylphosphatase [Myxococcota bacterium]